MPRWPSSTPRGDTTSCSTCKAICPLSRPRNCAPRSPPLADPAIDIATLVSPITDPAEWALPSVVKAACAFERGRAVSPALYFSRAAIPYGEGPRWHHIGVYAWRRAALARFVALPELPLERREKLEQLRALEAGMRIACVRVDRGPFGVDTPEDLERARRMLAE